jgi:hypothetical protein
MDDFINQDRLDFGSLSLGFTVGEDEWVCGSKVIQHGSVLWRANLVAKEPEPTNPTPQLLMVRQK